MLIGVAALVVNLPVVGDAVLDADRAVVDRIAEVRGDGLAVEVGTAMATLADTFTILGVITGAGVVLALVRRWRELAVLAVAVPLEMAVFATVATLTGRARPEAAVEAVAIAGSYPSGHSGMAVAVYGGLAVVVHRMTTDRVAERTAVVLATVIALLVGVGRLVQTMHYPSDIVLGWAEGAACLAVGVVASRHIRAEDRPVEEVPVATGAAP